MDPVAQGLLHQLDAAGDAVPAGVWAGLILCGDDAVDGLCERLRAPEPTRSHAARALAEIGHARAIPALTRAFTEHDVPFHAAGYALIAFGPPGGVAALEAARTSALVPEVRCALLAISARAGVPSTDLGPLLGELLPLAPHAALLVVALAPSEAALAAMRAHPSALTSAPGAALSALAACEGIDPKVTAPLLAAARRAVVEIQAVITAD